MQLAALNTDANEVLYGGAAFGGKSHLLRAASIIWGTAIPGLQIYLFRRQHPDLEKNHMEGPHGYRSLLAPWTACGLAEIVDGEVRLPGGSKVYLCHCKDEKDRFNYQGAEIHVLLVDELTHFTEAIYRFLRGRVRAVGLAASTGVYRQKMPRILCGSNPGNVGHAWVKAAFIDGIQPMAIRQMPDDEGGMLRQYIPARLDDNPIGQREDPTYRARLRGLGSEALVRAMEDGDWSVIEGAFFDCWSSLRHVLRPVDLPEHWLRFTAFDWGSAEPFSVGWYAVASERWTHPDGQTVTRGALVRYREWYGSKSPNVGLKMKNEDIAKGILEREAKGETIAYRRADPAIFSQHGGPSIAEQMANAGVVQARADNTRVSQKGAISGWSQVRDRLIGDGDGNPMLFVFSTGVNLIRTLPALQHHDARPEDVADGMEDHAPDELRYAANSRPWVKPKPIEAAKFALEVPTFNQLMQMQSRRDRDD